MWCESGGSEEAKKGEERKRWKGKSGRWEGGAGNVLRSVLIRGEDRGRAGSGIICYTTQRGQHIACRAVIEGERER